MARAPQLGGCGARRRAFWRILTLPAAWKTRCFPP